MCHELPIQSGNKHQMSKVTQEADMQDLQSQYDELAQSLDASEAPEEVEGYALRRANQDGERT